VTTTGSTQRLNLTLRDCTVRRATGCGLSFTADGDGQTSEYHMTLEGTLVDSPTSHGVFARLTQGYANLNVTVDGSTISRAGADGVHVEYDLTYWTWDKARARWATCPSWARRWPTPGATRCTTAGCSGPTTSGPRPGPRSRRSST